jgi:hypothetical protein
VVDIGWELAPHNLVVAPVLQRPILLPLGMHMYTMNVEGVSDPRILRAGTEEEVEVISGVDMAAMQLQLACHDLIANLP